jgi:hypothetical protein
MAGEPTEAEQRAKAWHDANHPKVWETCWCCCADCDPDYESDTPNPHYADAMQAMKADMRAIE